MKSSSTDQPSLKSKIINRYSKIYFLSLLLIPIQNGELIPYLASFFHSN